MARTERIHVGMVLASAVGLAIAAPLFWLMVKMRFPDGQPEALQATPIWAWLVGVAALLWVHELIHYACARVFVGNGKLGFKSFTPVCTYQGMMGRTHYLIYSLAPGVALGAAGLVLAFTPSLAPWVRYVGGALSTAGFASGGGDYILVAKALRFPSAATFADEGVTISVRTPGE